MATEPLVATHVLEYPYTRSVGPVIGRFLAGLKDGRIEGVRAQDGRILVPPTEYDPATGEAVTDEWVEVGPGGEVTTWAWIAEPRSNNPLDHGFAWALIKLDGADTAMLHVVDAGDEAAMRTGMRVRARFRDERQGLITDIEAFEPDGGPGLVPGMEGRGQAPTLVEGITSPGRLGYRYTPGVAMSRFLPHNAEGGI